MSGCTKTILDGSTRDLLIRRIEALPVNSQAQWGKMTLYQMLKHCTLWDEWIQEGKSNKVALIGRLIGGTILRRLLKDDGPLGKSTPTYKPLMVTGTGDVERQKAEWIARIEEYERYHDEYFIHIFFGKMTREQVGCLAYKHADHHLRQFGG